MAIHHGNLYNKLLSLVLGRYVVIHAKVNRMGVVVVEGNSSRNGAGHSGRDGVWKK